MTLLGSTTTPSLAAHMIACASMSVYADRTPAYPDLPQVAEDNIPGVDDRLLGSGRDPRRGSPAEFAAFVRQEVANWSDVAKRANVRAE